MDARPSMALRWGHPRRVDAAETDAIMHRRRDGASILPTVTITRDDHEDEDEDAGDAAVARALQLLQRDRQLRGAVLLQRSFRRYLNRTYDREDAVRTLQTWARRYLGRRQHHHHHEQQAQDHHSDFHGGRGSSVAPLPRRPPPPPPPIDQSEDDDDDDDDVDSSAIWGGRSRGGGGEREDASVAYYSSATSPKPLAPSATRSTAPLTDSDGPSTTAYTPWQDLPVLELRSSSVSSGGYATDDSGIFTHRQQQYEVFLWQGTQHGLELASCRVTGFPVIVDAATANVTLPGMWRVREGDYLLTVNDYGVHNSVMSFADVDTILEGGVRPAILRFRRPRIIEVQARDRAMAARGRIPRPRYPSPSIATRRSSQLSAATRRDIARQQERREASLCYLVWREEDGRLGIRFVYRTHSEYPEVLTIQNNGAAARATTLSARVSAGDMLLSINDRDVRSAAFEWVLQVLRCSPRPLVLVFRRAAYIDQHRVRMYEL